jgi:hypothetical protein
MGGRALGKRLEGVRRVLRLPVGCEHVRISRSG